MLVQINPATNNLALIQKITTNNNQQNETIHSQLHRL